MGKEVVQAVMPKQASELCQTQSLQLQLITLDLSRSLPLRRFHSWRCLRLSQKKYQCRRQLQMTARTSLR
jgi:hypothetical protein